LIIHFKKYSKVYFFLNNQSMKNRIVFFKIFCLAFANKGIERAKEKKNLFAAIRIVALI